MLLALLALQLALGLTLGRRWCLACVFYYEVLQPRFGEGPLEDSRPPRFANMIGLGFLSAASLAYLVGWTTLGAVLGGIVAALALLAAVDRLLRRLQRLQDRLLTPLVSPAAAAASSRARFWPHESWTSAGGERRDEAGPDADRRVAPRDSGALPHSFLGEAPVEHDAPAVRVGDRDAAAVPVGILRLDVGVAEIGEAAGDDLRRLLRLEVEDEQVVDARRRAGAAVGMRGELEVVVAARAGRA